ncbi:MAG: bifunctional protein-serine/threonine kinase/phosphatase [Verrucomicrobia bacterium]|nr:bifunctional protein-serine/threonine kinase/phosphatase [Verrucomicrobiota bacterium]
MNAALEKNSAAAAPEPSRAANGILRVSAETFAYARDERKPSEDASMVKEFEGAFLAAVADGLGSAKQGGEAATRAVEMLATSFPARPHAWSAGKALDEITRHLNRRFHHEGIARFESPELCTTLAAVVLEGDRLHALNAGDSRLYLWRSGALRQLSTDHREPQPERAHVLTNALGLAEEFSPATTEMTLQAGDVVLLCTDGVTDVLDDEALTALLAGGATAARIAAEARRRTTDELRDDLTAVTLRVHEVGPARRAAGRAPRVPDVLKVGDVVDGFTLRRSFRASDRIWLAVRKGDSYVLKFAPRGAASNDDALALFLREIWHATQLRAEFFPAASVPGDATACYYALEYIHAPTLKQFVAEHGPLAPAQAVELATFLLRAEQFLLGHDFVHGDLKPENILVLRDGAALRFKLIDLGSVAEVFSLQGRAGTPSYLAPERFQAASLSERTEIFSLGATLYEALTGRLPYGEVEPFQQPVFGAARPLTVLNPHTPAWLESIVARAIAVEPSRRYETYSEMLFELENPAKVRPFHRAGAPLFERNPLLFYKIGFFALLAVSLVLLTLLLTR